LRPGRQARRLRAELDAGSPLTRVCQHAGSALLAAAADDLVIRMCARPAGVPPDPTPGPRPPTCHRPWALKQASGAASRAG